MLLVFCPNKSIVELSIQRSILQGLDFLPFPKNKNSRVYFQFALQFFKQHKTLSSERISTIQFTFHHHAIFSVFKHFILKAIVLQFTTEMLNPSPNTCFLLKQNENHQYSSSSVNPIYNPHYFHWEIITIPEPEN